MNQIMHSTQPHWPGTLYGCLACEDMCNCDLVEVFAGRETRCIYCERSEPMPADPCTGWEQS